MSPIRHGDKGAGFQTVFCNFVICNHDDDGLFLKALKAIPPILRSIVKPT